MATATLLLGVFPLGCSESDSFSTPTQIAPPEPITGSWQDTSTITTAEGGGCLGPTFRSRKGEVESVLVDFVQEGTTLRGTLTFVDSGNLCTIGGTVDSTSVFFGIAKCDIEELENVPCNASIHRDMLLTDARFDGLTGDESISGTLAITYFTFTGGSLANASRSSGLRDSTVPEEGTELVVESRVELTR